MPLPTPPALNQMAQADADRSEMCGETVVASVLQALGQNVTPEDVIAWMRSVYGEPGVSAGTNGSEVIAAFAHWGVPAHAVSGGVAAYTATDLAQNFYTLCAIYSDSGGNPDPNHHTGHWILNYAPSEFMNPYGGRYVSYPDLTAEDQDYGIVVEVDPVAVAAVTAGTKQLAAWFIRGKFEGWPSSQASIDSIVGQLADDMSNFEAVATSIEQLFLKDGWVALADRIAGCENAIAALKTTPNIPQSALDEITKIEATLAAISKAAQPQ